MFKINSNSYQNTQIMSKTKKTDETKKLMTQKILIKQKTINKNIPTKQKIKKIKQRLTNAKSRINQNL